MTDQDQRIVWFSPSARRWWMHSTDALKAARMVEQYPDAIQVTNAYEVFHPEFIEHLRDKADADNG